MASLLCSLLGLIVVSRPSVPSLKRTGCSRKGLPTALSGDLPYAQTIELLTDGTFASAVGGAEKVVVDFFSEWCGPCKLVEQPLSELQAQGDVRVAKARLDECPSVYKMLSDRGIVIAALPTCVLFVNGEPARSLCGAFDTRTLERFVDGTVADVPFVDTTIVRGRSSKSRHRGNGVLQIAAAIPLAFIGVLAVCTVAWAG